MNDALNTRIAAMLARDVAQPVVRFAQDLAARTGALAVLFYGSNLRTGELEGVLDYYVLLPGPAERGIWPRVAYHERQDEGGQVLRAKSATMTLAKFHEAASGETIDTTIWARFVQPSALIHAADDAARDAVQAAVCAATATAARLAAVLGPAQAPEPDYWRALFRATYKAELRVEKPGREDSILTLNARHFDGLLPPALDAAGIAFARDGGLIRPAIAPAQRTQISRWWRRRQRLGKALNVARLVRATTTFDGAARYAAWKIERHTGVAVPLTPWKERHPIIAAPGVLWRVWRARKGQQA